MLQLLYIVALVAWIIFLNVQFRLGDRPVSIWWYAALAGLGTFECAKGFFSLTGNLPVNFVAFGAGLFATGCILIAHIRRESGALDEISFGEIADLDEEELATEL